MRKITCKTRKTDKKIALPLLYLKFSASLTTFELVGATFWCIFGFLTLFLACFFGFFRVLPSSRSLFLCALFCTPPLFYVFFSAFCFLFLRFSCLTSLHGRFFTRFSIKICEKTGVLTGYPSFEGEILSVFLRFFGFADQNLFFFW